MSQLLQVATRNTASAVEISTSGAVTHSNGGIPYTATGSIAVDSVAAVTHHHQGLPFTAAGELAVELNTAPARIAPGGVPMSASGRVVMGLIAPNHYSAGIPYNAVSSISYNLV
jgi:hypothetical protein